MGERLYGSCTENAARVDGAQGKGVSGIREWDEKWYEQSGLVEGSAGSEWIGGKCCPNITESV